MGDIKIGSKLKQYRLNRGWSIHDVVIELGRRYGIQVSDKTVYGWESDQSLPRTQTFLLLCELYQIEKPYENFPAAPQSRDFRITADERALIAQLRKHPDLREIVNRILDV